MSDLMAETLKPEIPHWKLKSPLLKTVLCLIPKRTLQLKSLSQIMINNGLVFNASNCM